MSDEIASAVLAAETISEKVQGLHRAQEEEIQRLQALETKRKKTRLGRDEYLNMLMLQDSIALRIKEIAEAERQLRFDQADVAMTQASVTHDKGVPRTRMNLQRIVNAIVDLHEAVGQFETDFDEQMTPLYGLTAPDGQPAFPELSISARGAAERFIAGLPQGSHLLLYLFEGTSHRPTIAEARAAADPVPGTKALSPRLIERYLQRYREETPHDRDL